jgi:ADP-ribose pyrophosphatase
MENLDWKRKAPTEVTKVGRRIIVTKTFELPDGTVETFDIKEPDEVEDVSVIALTSQRKALVVNIFRPGPEKMMQEIPGGRVDRNENPAAAAERELREETGYKVGSIAYLGYCQYDAYTNGKRHYFLATDCEPSGEGQKLDIEEQLTVEEISIEQLIANAMQARMTDPGAVLLAYDELLKRI